MILTPSFCDGPYPLPEYPRPQFKRDSYLALNGAWEFSFSPFETYPEKFEGKITVPYSPESALSGVGRQLKKDEFLHYRKTVTIPEGFNKGRIILNIGASDQITKVFVNKTHVCTHEGGYLSFSTDITDYAGRETEIWIVISDDADSDKYGRGKQRYDRGGIWYTAISGIWKSVWLESVPPQYAGGLVITPDYFDKTVKITVRSQWNLPVSVRLMDEKKLVKASGQTNEEIVIDASDCKPWTTASPELYPFVVTAGEDKIESYFGLRTFSRGEFGGRQLFLLNGEPVFYNGLLDQGYYGKGIYTPGSNEDLFGELQLIKSLGFNMLRMHIKVESALYYHYCDVLGICVIQDMVNGGGRYSQLRINLCPFINLHINDRNYKKMKRPSEESRRWFLTEASGTINELFSAVCIFMWTPFNEAWGQFDAPLVHDYLKKLDATRLFDHASGWQDKWAGDVCSRHVYFMNVNLKLWRSKLKGRVHALTEFGGYSFELDPTGEKRFGYKMFKSKERFSKALKKLYLKEITHAIRKYGLSCAVYTQLADVEDEVNGLLTEDRRLKCDSGLLTEINRELFKIFEETLKDKRAK